MAFVRNIGSPKALLALGAAVMVTLAACGGGGGTAGAAGATAALEEELIDYTECLRDRHGSAGNSTVQCRYIASEILSGLLPRSVQCSVFRAVHSKSWSPRGGVSTIQTVCRTSDGPSRRIFSSTPLLGPQERRPSNIRAAQLITLPQRSKFQPTLVLQDCRRTVSGTASKCQRPAGLKRPSDRPAIWPVSRLLLQADDEHPVKPYTRTPLPPSLLSLLCSVELGLPR
jgi:hypothetical protein